MRLKLAVLTSVALIAAVLGTHQALPGGSMPSLIWIALAPLALALWRAPPLRAAGLGFVYGMGSWSLAILGWADAAQGLFHLSPVASYALTLALAALQAVPFALAGYLTAILSAGPAAPLVDSLRRILGFAAACTVTLGWVPAIVPGGPAHALHGDIPALQLLAVGGLPLLLFVLLLANALVAEAVVQRRWRPVLLAAGVVLGAHAAGAARLAWPSQPDGRSLRIAGIQPAIGLGEHTAWALPADRARALDHLAAMTDDAAVMTPPPDLIVWPELPMVLAPQQEPAIHEWLAALARRAGRPVLVPGYAFEETTAAGAPRRTRSRAWLYDSQGAVVARHDKVRLIPFAEYLPLEHALPWLRALFPFTRRYEAESPAAPLAIGNGAKAIVAICYEAIFPADMRDQARAGGTIILNPVNDLWFGDSRLRALHLATTSFRAIELGVFVARVTNSGQTAFVAPTGRIDAAAFPPVDRPAIAVATVSALPADTPYVRTGDLFLWLVTGCLVAAMALRPLVKHARTRRDYPGSRSI